VEISEPERSSITAPKAELMPIRILVVDDHAIVREGLRLLLKFDEQLEVVGEASNGREALIQARELLPDVVLMDLLMPVMDGITATGKIREELPGVEVVALTSVLEDASVTGAIRAGAIGYLLKDTDGKELRRAIKAAAAGQVQLSPEAARRLMNEVHDPKCHADLTERELEVLCHLAQGLTNREIAEVLRIGHETVKTHVSRILAKLGTRSRTEAALYAWREGLVKSP
jgi:two-component system, NarL family, response regulator LiaR